MTYEKTLQSKANKLPRGKEFRQGAVIPLSDSLDNQLCHLVRKLAVVGTSLKHEREYIVYIVKHTDYFDLFRHCKNRRYNAC